MPFILPGNVGSATAATGFSVDNSCMFNSADSASLSKTPSSDGSNTVWTVSMWVKRASLASGKLHAAGTSDTYEFLFDDSNFGLTLYNGDAKIFETTRALRDISAWYSIVLAYNTGLSGTNKVKLFINGVQETSFSTDNRSSAGTMNHINQDIVQYVGRTHGGGLFDGYMAEVCIIDGTAYAASDFGEFDGDSGIWKPIDVSGLTFGTNGFYLDFKVSGNLGNDANGGTDLTETNLAAGDQSTDTCTNNYNVLNTVTQYGSHTLGEGNTELLGDTGYNHQGTTFGVNKGKWYVEIKHAQTRSKVFMLSLYNVENTVKTVSDDVWFSNGLGLTTFFLQLQNTNHATNRNYTLRKKVGTTQTTVTSTGGNITGGLSVGTIGVYIDMDNKRLHFYNNGTALDTSNAASSSAGSGAIPAGTYALGLTDVRGGSDAGDDGVLLMNWNFGSPNANISISSGNTDANGYGNFEYSPTVGGVSYYAMNTKNLAEFG